MSDKKIKRLVKTGDLDALYVLAFEQQLCSLAWQFAGRYAYGLEMDNAEKLLAPDKFVTKIAQLFDRYLRQCSD